MVVQVYFTLFIHRRQVNTGANALMLLNRYDQKSKLLETLKVNLTRPLILVATEPILWCFNIYIGIIYSILYLCFVAYPLIYTDIRGWSTGITGLSFLGIAVGTILAIV